MAISNSSNFMGGHIASAISFEIEATDRAEPSCSATRFGSSTIFARGSERDITSPNTFRDKRRWTADYILMPFGFDRVLLKIQGA
jgi:hypothetical protein